MRQNGYRSQMFKNDSGPEFFFAQEQKRKNYLSLLKTRDQIRNWLKEKGYLEVLVPTLYAETVPDLNLESFRVDFQSVFDPNFKRQLYLQTSPELLMKQMLVSGFERIFYLGPVFRQGELSETHHPEFTMAEWYHVNWNYMDLMDELSEMLRQLFGIRKIRRLTMRDALLDSAGIDFLQLRTQKDLALAIQRKNSSLRVKGLDWSELFELALVEWLSPWLKAQGVILIYDWPSEFAMQGKIKDKEHLVCERFELYINGLEIANGYSEETDSEEMKKRFKTEIKKRKNLKREQVSLPEKFLASLKLGLPNCAGVSLGLERLCMALLGIDNLDQLLPFRTL